CLINKLLCDVRRNAPAAQEPSEYLTTVPIPAAAASGAIGHVQDQIARGPLPQDALIVGSRQVQGARLKPCGQALQPSAPFAQRLSYARERLLWGRYRIPRAAPAPDRTAIEVSLVVRPAPAQDPAAVGLCQSVRHGIGPRLRLVVTPCPHFRTSDGDVGAMRNTLRRPERTNHLRRRAAVERMTARGHLIPAQKDRGQIVNHDASLSRPPANGSTEFAGTSQSPSRCAPVDRCGRRTTVRTSRLNPRSSSCTSLLTVGAFHSCAIGTGWRLG